MANGNVDYAYGVRSLKGSAGSDRNAELSLVHFDAADATAVFMGSPVKYTGDADTVEKVPNVTLADPGDRVAGIVQGFRPDYRSGLNNDNKSRQASTDRYASIIQPLPGETFEVQANAALTSAMVGQLFDLTAEVGNAVTGRSTVELDVASASTASGQVRLVRILNTPNNEFDGTGAGTDCVVQFNESLYSTEANTGV